MFGLFKKRRQKKIEKQKNIESFNNELKERQKEIDKFNKESKAETIHFETMAQWQELKAKVKDDKSLYSYYIELLQIDCDVHDDFVKEYYKRWQETASYPAFKELAIAYERTGEIQKAIDISKEAIDKNVVEHTSFENRIKRLEKKL